MKFWVICPAGETHKVFNIKIFRKVYLPYALNIYIFVNLLFCCSIRGWISCTNETVIYLFLLKVFRLRTAFLGTLIVSLFCFVLIISFIYWFSSFVSLRWWLINVVLLMLSWKPYTYLIEIIRSVKSSRTLLFYASCSCQEVDSSYAACRNNGTAIEGSDILEKLNVARPAAVNIAALLLFNVMFRILAYLSLRYVHKPRWWESMWIQGIQKTPRDTLLVVGHLSKRGEERVNRG